jgi:plastocyanin
VTKPPASGLRPFVVHIRNFAYVPAPAVIVGQPIEIINDDVAAHTWSAAPGAGWTYTSGNLEKNARVIFPGFPKPGRYKFLCYYHAEMPSMNGVATVRAAP